MKRSSLIHLALVVALLVGLFSVSAVFAGPEKARVMVQFAPGKGAAVEQALKGAGAEFHYSFANLNVYAVSLPQAALAGIQNNPNVVLVEEDAPRYMIGIQRSKRQDVSATPQLAGSQVVPYGVDLVQARDVWDANRDGAIDTGAPTGSNRTLCIIDSGLLTSHEDFQGVNVLGGYTTISSGWEHDMNGHGTHVAGTITAMNNALGVVGVTPGTVNLYIVRVFGDDGVWAYASSLVDAANRCASAGANVISMSLGGSRSVATERRAFDSLYAQGILSIAAAGNEGTSANSYPASYSSVVSVAAVDETKTRADFSQYNSQVELSAPGVHVLSTIPYLDDNKLTVDGVTYAANHIEFSGRGAVSGALVNGGLCDSTNSAWSGKIVLCERGVIAFLDKVNNVANSGGAAAAIYNNAPGNFLGTLGDGSSSTLIAISLSQEDGQYLVANKLGLSATLASSYTWPSNTSYEYYDGTSMATPHVSAVAALVWSAKPTATNVEIRDALANTALDLGAAGRDVYYGYGLVQAKAAIDSLGGGGPTVEMRVSDLDAVTTTAKNGWKITVTITVVDANGAPVSGAKVDGKFNTTAVSCTTGANGQCSVTATAKNNVASVTYTVTNVTASGYAYNSAANSDPDGDSNGTSIVINKP